MAVSQQAYWDGPHFISPPGTPAAGPGSGGWIFCSASPGNISWDGVLGSPPGDLAMAPLILLAQSGRSICSNRDGPGDGRTEEVSQTGGEYS